MSATRLITLIILLACAAPAAASAPPWTTAVEVAGDSVASGVLPDDPPGNGPAMAVDPLGPVTIATRACSPYHGYYGTPCSQSLQGLLPFTTADGAFSQGSQLGGGLGGNNYGRYAIATGDGGDTVAVFGGCRPQDAQQYGYCDDTSGNTTQFGEYAFVRPSGSTTWSDPILIADDPGLSGAGGEDDATVPQVVVDADGNAWIAWLDAGTSQLEARSLQADDTLGAVQTVSSDAVESFTLAGDPAGHGELVFKTTDPNGTNGYAVNTSVLSGGQWSTPVLIDESGYSDQSTFAAIGPAGEPVAGWCAVNVDANGDGAIRTRTRSAGGVWAPAQTIPDTANVAGCQWHEQIPTTVSPFARDDAGDLVLAWAENDGADPDYLFRVRVASLAAGATQWTTQLVDQWGPPPNSQSSDGPVDVAMDGPGDVVVAYAKQVETDNSQVAARVAPAGHPLGAPEALNNCTIEYCTNNRYAYPVSTVMDDHGIATVSWTAPDNQADTLVMAASTTTPLDGSGGGGSASSGDSGGGSGSAGDSGGNSGSGGGTPPPSGGTGYVLRPLVPSPGRQMPAGCGATFKMPDLLGHEHDPALAKLLSESHSIGFVAGVKIVERHPAVRPKGVADIGQVYAQSPATGKRVDSCHTHVRLVIYGAPAGVKMSDFRQFKSLAGQRLDTAPLPAGFDITYRFKLTPVANPTVEQGGVDLTSLAKHEVTLTVELPEDRSHDLVGVGYGAPFPTINPDYPAPGTDGALRQDAQHLIGLSAWAKTAVNADFVVDTHEVDDIANGATNLHGSETTRAAGDGAIVPAHEPTFQITPHSSTGHVYVAAFAPCAGRSPCAPIVIGVAAIPVVKARGVWQSQNHYRYNGTQYAGPSPGSRAATRQAGTSTDYGPWWSRLFFYLTHGSGAGGETTVAAGAKPAPPGGITIQGGAQDGPVDPNNTSPTGRLVYDFSSGLYPLIDGGTTGLPVGQVYEYRDGKAVNLLDGSSHVVAAGGGNLQQGEVFGVVAAGGGNVIGAGGGNVQWPTLDGDAYGLQPGSYQVNRDSSTGHVVFTPVNVIGAGGGNVIGAGGGNVIGAGGGNLGRAVGNLADGYYNVIGAGGGNVIGAGGGNVIGAGGGNLSGYQELASQLPEAWLRDQTITTMQKDGQLAGNALTNVGGRFAGNISLDIPAVTSSTVIGAGGGNVIGAGGGNVIGAGGGNVIGAGGGNVIGAGGGNVIGAGGGNVIGAGGGNVIGAGGGN